MNTINYMEDPNNKVGIIEINRPKQLNALNKEVILELEQTLDEIANNSKIRSGIIIGSGTKAFVAGADIKEFKNFSKAEAYQLSKSGKIKLFDKIANFNKPIIAAINGFALGGGLELALSCHIRIASTNAKLGFPECSLGIIPGYSGTQRLPRIIGINRAMELILTSKMIDSDEAHRIGLINYHVTQDLLLEKALEIAKLCANNSPEALTAAIKSINRCYFEDGDTIEGEEFSNLFATDNFNEGVSAFLEKRKPNFNA